MKLKTVLLEIKNNIKDITKQVSFIRCKNNSEQVETRLINIEYDCIQVLKSINDILDLII
jgi:hypothetical protein